MHYGLIEPDIDCVNGGIARWACDAGPWASLLATAIDRGGAYAHVCGTRALLPEDLRPGLAGVVLNKFRGNAALLAPGPARLQARTGVPTVAVLRMWREHGLPEEDGLFDAGALAIDAGAHGLHVSVVAYPRIRDLDVFQPLR